MSLGMRFEESHVDEERLVLWHIGEILNDYQKYQQAARSNPNSSGVPTSENRWIQRCLVLLNIATLTRKVPHCFDHRKFSNVTLFNLCSSKITVQYTNSIKFCLW